MLKFFRKKTTLQAPLGRWGAIVRNTREDNSILRENSIDFNSNWANHDHCGAEACQIMNNEQEKTKNDTPDTKNKKSTNSITQMYDIYNDKDIMNHLPYMIW